MGENDNRYDDGAAPLRATAEREQMDEIIIEHEVTCKHCGDICEDDNAEYSEFEVEEMDDNDKVIGSSIRGGYVGVCPECALYCGCGNLMTQHEKDTVGVCQECR
jgi:hypothetical protein